MSDVVGSFKTSRGENAGNTQGYEITTHLRKADLVGSNLLAQDSPTSQTIVLGLSRLIGLSFTQQQRLWAARRSAAVFGRQGCIPTHTNGNQSGGVAHV